VPDKRKKHISIPLNGKLMTTEPTAVGQNFRTLTNLRYTDTHLKGVAGMTKINTSAISTYLKVRNAFNFRKAQPSESHVLCQGYNTGLTASRVLDHRAVVPATGNFYELMTLDTAPASAWVAGNTITGASSGKTCTIVELITTLTYVVSGRSGTYTSGEILSNGTVTADQGTGYPTFTEYTLWTDSSGASRGYFSDAPDGQMIYCNEVDTCIWGGDELRIGGAIISTATVGVSGASTEPKDVTEQLQNTNNDSDNVASLGGGVDTYCVLMIHGDEADTTAGTSLDDASASNHTITAVGHAAVDWGQAYFGVGSVEFDGDGDYLTVPDHANWYFAADPFTIDCWVRFSDVAVAQGIVGQYSGANDYWFWKWDANVLTFEAKATTVKASYTVAWIPVVNTWYHLELARSTTSVYMFINGVKQTLTVGTAVAANEIPNIGAVLEVGACSNHGVVFKGWIDEFRISKGTARHTITFTVRGTPYSTAGKYLCIGSQRPLKGVKFYVSNPNVETSTLTGSTWTGTAWDSLTLTDYTSSGGISLAQTGKVVFDTTTSITVPRYISGYFLYWYQFYLDAGGVALYHVTVDAPFQLLKDLWDGNFRDVSAFYVKSTILYDETTGVLKTDYDSSIRSTYADLTPIAAYSAGNHCVEMGFVDKITGVKIGVCSDPAPAVADNVMSVDYWNGKEYVSVGTISDGTLNGTISTGKSGIVTWSNTNLADETRLDQALGQSVGGSQTVKGFEAPLFFYRIRWTKDPGGVRWDYVGGITAPFSLGQYKFPVFAQGRVLLCCDMAGQKNKITCSGKWTPHAYNGEDTVDIYFGDDNELTCGIELYSQYAGNLYSLVMLFKDNESWIMAGQDIEQWKDNIFPLSNTIGCPAPQTLKTVNLAAEPGQGINRNLVIWQGINGIYMSDGRAPIPIHRDIEKYFDRSDSSCIKASMVGDSVGFIDPVKQEYHWLFASGTSTTTLNKEMVYDIHRNKWYEIDRTSSLDLQCGMYVQDTYGNTYPYGFIDTGYIERLENGSDFDGEDIVHTVQTGDFAPLGLEYITQLDHLKLVAVAKATADTSVTATHYGDSYTTGTDKTLSLVNTNYRLAQPYWDEKLIGDPFHSLKFTITTDDATCGFEPLAVVATFHPLMED